MTHGFPLHDSTLTSFNSKKSIGICIDTDDSSPGKTLFKPKFCGVARRYQRVCMEV